MLRRRRPEPDPWSEESRADDAEAAALLARTGAGVRRARTLAHAVLTVALVGFGPVLLLAVVVTALGGPADLPGLAALVLLAAGAGAGLGWSILADLDTRTVRAAARRWLDTAPRAARERGLPRPFYRAWWEFPPGHRVLSIAAYLGGAAGVALVVAVPAVLLEGLPPALTLLGLPGLALLGLAVQFVVVHRRRRRTDRAWLEAAASPRPPV